MQGDGTSAAEGDEVSERAQLQRSETPDNTRHRHRLSVQKRKFSLRVTQRSVVPDCPSQCSRSLICESAQRLWLWCTFRMAFDIPPMRDSGRRSRHRNTLVVEIQIDKCSDALGCHVHVQVGSVMSCKRSKRQSLPI